MLIHPLIRCGQALLQGGLACFDVLEVLSQRASEVAGKALADVLAVVMAPEDGLEQVGDIAAAAIWRIQAEHWLGLFVFCRHG